MIRVSKELSRFVIIFTFSVSNFLSFPWKPHCFVLHLISCCSIFKDHLTCRSLWVPLALATYILYHILSRLSRGFAKVFEVFFELLDFAWLSQQLWYYIIFSVVCQEVFQKIFEIFSSLCFFVSLAHSFNIISHIRSNVNTFLSFLSHLSLTWITRPILKTLLSEVHICWRF